MIIFLNIHKFGFLAILQPKINTNKERNTGMERMKKETKKEPLLAEGKTKKIFSIKSDDGLIIVENKPDITADNDPEKTRQFARKAEYATTTTCRVFELLEKAGIPVAYKKQLSPTEFLA